MNYRSPLFNFLLGTAAGAVLATVPLLEHFTHVVQREVAAHEAVVHDLADHIEKAHAAIQEHQQTIEELQARAAGCETASKAQAQELGARDFRDSWFTLVYEPEPNFAPTQQGQALAAMLNVIRPGLGTVLAQVQAPSQPGMQLRMVLDGYVRAEQVPPGVHLVYTLDRNIANSASPTPGKAVQ